MSENVSNIKRRGVGDNRSPIRFHKSMNVLRVGKEQRRGKAKVGTKKMWGERDNIHPTNVALDNKKRIVVVCIDKTQKKTGNGNRRKVDSIETILSERKGKKHGDEDAAFCTLRGERELEGNVSRGDKERRVEIIATS